MAEIEDVQALETVPVPVYLINESYGIEWTNKPTVQGPCYQVIWGRESPCPDCKLAELLKSGQEFKRAGQTDSKPTKFLVGQYKKQGKNALAFIEDRSPFIEALSSTKNQLSEFEQKNKDLEKKMKAHDVMLRHKNKKMNSEIQGLKDILQHMASGVLLIDENFKTQFANQPLKDLVGSFFDEMDPSACHSMLYQRSEVCEDCPIQNKSNSTIRSEAMNTEKAKGYLTEEISKVPQGYVLTVSNSTRTIELAKNIQTYLREIEEINRIVQEVMEKGSFIQGLAQMEEVIQQSVEVLADTILRHEGPIFLFSRLTHGRNVQHISYKNIESEMRNKIIDLVNCGDDELQAELHDWWCVNFGAEKRPGALWIQGNRPEEKRINIIKIFLNNVTSIMEQLNLVRELERLASMDGLTGTFNRRFFENRFAEEKEKCESVGIPFSMLVMDLNGLKRINDVYGHQAGDEFIKNAGVLLKAQLREQDILARFGGDEFVALLPSTNKAGLEKVQERIVQAQIGSTYNVSQESSDRILEPIHFSVGGCSSEEADVENVFGLADERMYADKEKYYETRNRYR